MKSAVIQDAVIAKHFLLKLLNGFYSIFINSMALAEQHLVRNSLGMVFRNNNSAYDCGMHQTLLLHQKEIIP